MADPIFSPDGKWMWTGSDWIPAPPSSASGADSTINLEDSMISGNVNVEQNSNDASSTINLKDSAMSGDINITQNNAEDIATAMVRALERMGFSGQSSPAELTPSQEAEVEQVLEMSEQLAGHGIEIDPLTEITLGNAAKLAGRTHSAQQHYMRALETFRKNGDRQGEAASLNNLGIIAEIRGDLDEAERLQRESLAIMREIGDRQGEADSLINLGNIANTRGDLAEAERLQRESVAIKREIGDRQGEAASLINLGIIMNSKGQHDEERRMYTSAVRIQREIGIPVEQWFIDNGY
jgi:tetratricopeptide (TPR) repeat protein